MGAEIFWELFFCVLGINFFSMVSIPGGAGFLPPTVERGRLQMS